MKSWTKPTPELLDRAIASTLDSEQRRYFLQKLQNPFWVKPLSERGFFRNPPKLLPVGDGSFQVPFWPESQFLARVAKDTPDEVVEIALRIQTDNPHVLEDIVDIALAVESPELSSKLSKHALAMANNQFARWRVQKLIALLGHWAKQGAIPEALQLADSLLSLCPDPKAKEKEEVLRADPYSLQTRLKPYTPHDEYVFKKILDEGVKPLAIAAPWETTKMLYQTLSEAISYSHFDSESTTDYDGSDFWCHHLKQADGHEHDLKSPLSHALTNACIALLSKSPESICDLDTLLRQTPWYFFKRLRWFLYSEFPNVSKAFMKTEALAFEGYYDGEYGLEFALMLRAASESNVFASDELCGIFATIDRGPDLDAFKQWLGEKGTDAQVQGRKEYFFVKQMFPFLPVLPRFPEYLEKYQLLAKKQEGIKFSDYMKYRVGGGGEARFIPDASPISAEELVAKPDDELLSFLSSWKPKPKDHGFDEPNASGLAKAFAEALQKQPDRFLNLADRITIPNTTCVRDFLYFLVSRAKQKESIPWEKVVNLCQWIVLQPNDTAKTNDLNWREGEPDFTSARQEIAGLIQHGSGDYPYSIPWNLRASVFDLLDRLCTEYDRRLEANSFGRDFITQAINSVRGEAAHALIDHALWIKRQLKPESNAIEKMPEVKRLIEDRLNPDREKALAVQATFGRLSPWLCNLDPDWFTNVRGRIFPVEPKYAERWFASWATFVSWNHPNGPLFKFLKSDYETALERIELLRSDEKSQHPAVNALGEHLITFYWWGFYPVSGSGSLIEKYLAKANTKERAHVMNYVGRVLENSEELPGEVETRLIEYWEHRLKRITEEDNGEEASEELSDFAWWFRSGKLNTAWCLKQIQSFLDLVPQVHETLFLLEDLAKVAPNHPLEAAMCLQKLVNKISNDRYIYLEDEHAKAILRIAINSEIPQARKTAELTQDSLLRLGRFEYKDLTPAPK